MVVQILRKKFTVKQYRQMVIAGILIDPNRLELLAGEVVEMPAVGQAHRLGIHRLVELLGLGLAFRAISRVQSPLGLGPTSAPRPDIALLRQRVYFYAGDCSEAEDVFAVVEVADTTEEFDRLVKLPIYAEHGIGEVWIVDLLAGAVQVYRQPREKGYGEMQVLRGSDEIGFQAFPDVGFTVDELFGREE